jgi:methylenetetrahydrofolate reductase (NADPH)
MNSLAQTLHDGTLAVTAECLPPRSADAAGVRKLAAGLPERLNAVVVPEGQLACAAILAGEKRQPVLSLLTRDRNRMALESDALGAAALGIGSVLCLSGDHQSLGASANPQAAGAYDVDSVQLLLGLKNMCDSGVDFAGRRLDSAPKLLLGAAASPYLRPMELNILRLKKKIKAGAAYLVTQAVFDLAPFVEWMDAVRAAGIERQVAIIAGVLPLTSVEQARRLAAEGTSAPVSAEAVERMAKAADPAKEGITIAAEVARKLKAIAGVRGIHIFAGGCESAIAAVIQEAGLA